MLTAMLLAAATTTVVVSTDDSFHVPQVERLVLEAQCNDREIKVIEQKGTMSLVVDGKTRDISGSAFAMSYSSGSFLGRFTVACRRDNKGFSLNFFGVDVPQEGAPVTAAGSIAFDSSVSTTADQAIARTAINLYQFNKRRSEYWLR